MIPDWVYWFLGIAILMIVGTLLSVLNLWDTVLRMFNQKPIIETKGNITAPPKGSKILIKHPTKGIIPYFGKEDHGDGRVSLLDKEGRPYENLKSYQELYLNSVKADLEGNNLVRIYEIRNNDFINNLQNENLGKDIRISKLLDEVKQRDKTIGEINLTRAKEDRAAWDAEHKGKKIVMIKKPGSYNPGIESDNLGDG